MVSLLANIGSQGVKSQKEEKQPQKEAPKEINEAYTKVVAYGKHIYKQESRKEERDRKSQFYAEQIDKFGNEYSLYKRIYSSPDEKRKIQKILDDLLKSTTIELYEFGEKYSNFLIYLKKTDSEKVLIAKMVLIETLSGYSYDSFVEWQKGQDESTLDSIIGDRVL